MPERRTKTIRTDYLARVEGEGAMLVTIDGGEVTDVKLKIYEPPRFFEAFLRGRAFTEAPDITARICGICPVAYQMSSVQAMEQACGVEVGGQLRALRRLLYCGEWIESHALHVFMLHLPDFLGYESAIEVARDNPELVDAGARAEEDRQRGDDGRRRPRGAPDQRHASAAGTASPRKRELAPLVEKLERAREIALEAVRVTAGLDFPDYEQDYELVALVGAGRVPDRPRPDRLQPRASTSPSPSTTSTSSRSTSSGRTRSIRSSRGRGSYLCGPLARFALGYERALPARARGCRADAGVGPGERNPFRSIVVRSVELVYAADEALRLIAEYEEPDAPAVEVEPRAGVGYGCTEAPRGILYHRYRIDDEGTILDAKIVPPTSQNQRTIEEDLRGVVERSLDIPDEELTLLCEQTIRNYDPCISCATHFLKLEVERR